MIRVMLASLLSVAALIGGALPLGQRETGLAVGGLPVRRGGAALQPQREAKRHAQPDGHGQIGQHGQHAGQQI